MGEGQYELDEAACAALNEHDDAAIAALEPVRPPDEAEHEDPVALAVAASLRGHTLRQRSAEVAVQAELVDQPAVEVAVEVVAEAAGEVVGAAGAEAVDGHRRRARVELA